jgi:hypothetical protein
MLWWLAPFSSAQPAVPAVRFTVFSAKPIANLTFVPRANAAPAKLAFFPTARSARMEYRGAMPIRFTDATTGAVVAEAMIPPEIREPLLLFSAIEPAPEKGLRYQVAVLDDSAVAHAAGALTIINLSGLALSGNVGTQAVTLQPGLNAPLPVGRSAKIALRTTAKSRTVQAYADTVQLTPKQRALLILFPPFYKGSLEVQSRLLLDEPTSR